MKRILVYGDSATWGYVPGVGTRWDENTRWPMILQKELGDGYVVFEDGINGRTTAFDRQEIEEYQNGVKGLGYALISNKPLDLVIVMLGLNDLIKVDAATSARGLAKLGNRILNADAFYKFMAPPCSGMIAQPGVFPNGSKLLIVSPYVTVIPKGSSNPADVSRVEETKKFARYTESVADNLGCFWMDAAPICSPSEIDGVHLDEQANRALGIAVASKVKEIFEK